MDSDFLNNFTLMKQDGTTFCNGYPPAYGSREIKACADTAMLGDEQLKAIKAAVPSSMVVA